MSTTKENKEANRLIDEFKIKSNNNMLIKCKTNMSKDDYYDLCMYIELTNFYLNKLN